MDLPTEARELAAQLRDKNRRVVFAESCTAGLVSASLAGIPGISKWHCGSAVTYREATKTAWLDVSVEDLQQHSAVSEPVARQMALGVLQFTPEADYSAAVTGHLGPDAPPELDGVIYVAIAHRDPDGVHLVGMRRLQLETATRGDRQREAAALVLRQLAICLH